MKSIRNRLGKVGKARLFGACFLAVGLLIPLMGASSASASTSLSGAVFTTDSNCAQVNGNIYDTKQDVYIDGGPQSGPNGSDLPDGSYYVRVTVPSPNGPGALLGTSIGSGNDRPFVVSGGTPASCLQLWSNLIKASDSTQGYDDTLNPGGEYKVWVSSSPDFVDNSSKTDIFKVKITTPPSCLATSTCVTELGDPTVSKDATPSFDRKYTWGIAKDADNTTIKKIGGMATFNYTVSVTHDSGTDSNWQVNGTITVANQEAYAVTGVGVTDTIDDGGTCTVQDGAGSNDHTHATIPANGTASFDYKCTYSSASTTPDPGHNTAHISWPEQSTNIPTGTTHLAAGTADSDPVAVDFSSVQHPNLIDDSVDVTDPLAPLGKVGTASYTDPSPTSFASYPRTVNVPANGCQSYDNTATFTTNTTHTTGTASKTVNVCGPAKTGALTIGFWKTTNGQNLVNTYCTNGANNLGTYLGSLGAGSGPFSGAPTGCPALKTYVSGILNGASATDMNKMLKAQMLATALDVWFSGSGWTSTTANKIKPPSNFLSHNSLGGFNMDTTAVCPMVDNTTAGTATCKNNLPSTNAVTSGAVPTNPMTMQEILNYAATTTDPFNAGVWYAGNRTKQEILKNIYDQFNNQMAFSF